MKRILLLTFWQFGLLAGGRLFADVVILTDGRQIYGLMEAGNTREIHIKVEDQSPARPNAAALSSEPAPTTAAPTLKAGASRPAETVTPGTGAGNPVGATESTGCQASADDEYAASLVDPITCDGVEVAPANAFDRGKAETGDVDSRAGSQDRLTLTGKVAGAGATGAGPSAPNLIGKRVEIAPETRFTSKVIQPAFINSDRGRQ